MAISADPTAVVEVTAVRSPPSAINSRNVFLQKENLYPSGSKPRYYEPDLTEKKIKDARSDTGLTNAAREVKYTRR
jgi:hypothetical protein